MAKRTLNNNELNINDIKIKYNSLLKTTLNYQTFLELMDIIRLTQDQAMIWDLITLIMSKNHSMKNLSKKEIEYRILNQSEMNYIPKEIYYLVKLLKNIGDESFLSNKKELLIHYENELKSLFENPFLKDNLY